MNDLIILADFQSWSHKMEVVVIFNSNFYISIYQPIIQYYWFVTSISFCHIMQLVDFENFSVFNNLGNNLYFENKLI